MTRLGRAVMLRSRVARVADSNARLRGGLPGTRWAVRVSAPLGPDGDRYGDVPFADDLAAALSPFVQSVRVFRLDEEVVDVDVVVTLRGLAGLERIDGAVNVLWVISHPELVTDDELRAHDLVYAASMVWAPRRQRESGVVITPLLQATNPARFRPDPATRQRAGVLFVGTTRGVERPAVLWAIDAGAEVEIHGHGWEPYVPAERIASTHMPNRVLPKAYAAADIVLNDHWTDMAREGFISNRVFDAVASGAVVVSDRVAGIDEISPTLIRTFGSRDDLARILHADDRPGLAERAQEASRVGAVHSFDARASRMVSDVGRIVTSSSGIRRLSLRLVSRGSAGDRRRGR
ncbi:glycosyltransferase family 1 protein [Agromyces sp. ISL-38]|uniref:glycosyltransferase family protein n=1 Tax=Agromyces sp. ISL-38 TaxID=2819107 RepID=UPI001BE5E690|nr:glycosyltransferase [Agromyces sp. ISL-38]MBT2500317.1 glycosyltransferase family 1 protein [Agromyces sp. ISL-38]